MTACRFLLVTVLRLVVLAGLAAAGLATGSARAEAARDWERLPDGRVVIEIYGRRLAFQADTPAVFVHGQRPHRTRPGGWEPRQATLREVIADRAAVEAWWADPHPSMPVGITISSRLVEPLLFEGSGPVDRSAVRLTPAFEIWVYHDPTHTYCARVEFEGDRRRCAYFLERSHDQAAIGPEGFIVERPAMMRGTGKTYFVFPAREGRAALGDPAHIACLEFPGSFYCENGSSTRYGYFIQPGILLTYRYSMSKTDRQDMRRIDDAFRVFFARHFIKDTADAR